MIEHRCSIGERGGFFQRLRSGTYLGHILEHVTLELQTLAGTEVGFGKARETSEDGRLQGRHRVRRGDGRPRVSGRGPRAVPGRGLRSAVRRRRPRSSGCAIWPSEVCLGPSTRAIVEAAQARGIPYRRLNTESLVLFGHGRKQRRIQAAETDRTSAIAEAIAQDKEMTRMLLRAVGVPTPDGRPVKDAEDAWAAAVRDRRAGGRQAAGRQPGPRRGHEPHHARAGRRGLRSGPAGKRVGAGREVRPRPRLSPAGRRRSRGGGRPPRAGPRRRRRRPHRSPNWSSRSTPIRAAANITPRCSARSSSTPSRWPCWPIRASRPTRFRRPARSC